MPALAQEVPPDDQDIASAADEEAGVSSDEKEAITVTGQRSPKKRRVCRRAVVTGSIMPRTTCRTVAEWEEITAQSVATLERLAAERQTRAHVQESRGAK